MKKKEMNFHVINPYTGRKIIVGGATYNKVFRGGGNDDVLLPPPPPPPTGGINRRAIAQRHRQQENAARAKIENMTGKQAEAMQIIYDANKKLSDYAKKQSLVGLKTTSPQFIKGFNLFLKSIRMLFQKITKTNLTAIEQRVLKDKVKELITEAESVKNMAAKLCSYLEAYQDNNIMDRKTLQMVRRGQQRCLDLPDMIDNAIHLLKKV